MDRRMSPRRVIAPSLAHPARALRRAAADSPDGPNVPNVREAHLAAGLPGWGGAYQTQIAELYPAIIW